jgi:hypothetical protein
MSSICIAVFPPDSQKVSLTANVTIFVPSITRILFAAAATKLEPSG